MFFLDRHRLGARTDCGFGLRPLPDLSFWGFGFLFVLLLTSLHLDDRDFWLAFGLAVVLPLLALQVRNLRSGCGFPTLGRGVSLAERGPLWCPATPRDGVIPRRVCKWEVPLVSSFIVRQATI